jgi:excisionase family DNA binding protein
MADLPEYITVTAAAKATGLDPRLLRQLCEAGEFNAWRFDAGARWRLDRAAVLAYAEQHRPQATVKRR